MRFATVLILIPFFLMAKIEKLATFKNSNQILALVEKYLPEDPIILEAGAFNGNDSVLMAKKWVKGTIHSFEPIDDVFEKLQNKVKNCSNVNTYKLAIGDIQGQVDMYISEHKNRPGQTFASSSLLAPKKHLTYAPHITFPKTIKVPVTTFDLWAKKNDINRVDFLWLDMQGYELNALKASPKLLESVKVILTEVLFIEAYKGQYQYQDMKDFLEKKGFVMIAIDKQYGWFGDALFVKKELIK